MENGVDDVYLFAPSLITDLDWETSKSLFKGDVCPANPGKSLEVRPLCVNDYDKGYTELLSQLTLVGDVSSDMFKKRFKQMVATANTYYIVVIEDQSKERLIGAATLVVEQKFIHSTGMRGRIEDVVVSTEYRGQQLGKLLVRILTLMGKHLGCYKMSLECKEENVGFYQSLGYSQDPQFFMVQRFKE